MLCREGKAGVVLSRLKSEIGSEGGEIEALRVIPPALEDVFIALSDPRLEQDAGSESNNA